MVLLSCCCCCRYCVGGGVGVGVVVVFGVAAVVADVPFVLVAADGYDRVVVDVFTPHTHAHMFETSSSTTTAETTANSASSVTTTVTTTTTQTITPTTDTTTTPSLKALLYAANPNNPQYLVWCMGEMV